MSRNKFPLATDDFIATAAQVNGMQEAAQRVALEAVLRDFLVRDSAGAIADGFFRGQLVVSGNGANKTLAFTAGWGCQVKAPTGNYETEYALGGTDAGTLTIPNNTTGSPRGDTIQARVFRDDEDSASVKHRDGTTPFAQGTQAVYTTRTWDLELSIKEGTTGTPPAPDAGYFSVYTYTIPDSFTTSDQWTETRITANELYINGANVAPYPDADQGFVKFPASAFNKGHDDWDLVQPEASEGLTTPGYFSQTTVGTDRTLVLPLVLPSLNGCTLILANLEYHHAADAPGTASERAWFNVIRYDYNGGTYNHTSLAAAGATELDGLAGTELATQTFDQLNVVDMQQYAYIVVVRGVETGTLGDKVYALRLAYTRPTGSFQP